jgi:hypothetical protein
MYSALEILRKMQRDLFFSLAVSQLDCWASTISTIQKPIGLGVKSETMKAAQRGFQESRSLAKGDEQGIDSYVYI